MLFRSVSQSRYLAGGTVGIVYENHNHSIEPENQISIIPDLSKFDQFSYESRDVQNNMNYTLENPTRHNLIVMNNDLIIVREKWANQQTGQKKELYLNYIKSCENVITDLLNGQNVNTEEMFYLYSQLQKE